MRPLLALLVVATASCGLEFGDDRPTCPEGQRAIPETVYRWHWGYDHDGTYDYIYGPVTEWHCG